MIVSAGGDCTIRLWSVNTGKEVRRILDGPPQIWDLPMEPDREELLSEVGPTGGTVLSRDGKTAFSASVDGSIRSWDLVTSKQIQRIKLEQVRPIRTIGFSPDFALVAASFKDGDDLALWEVATGKAIRRVTTNGEVPTHISFSRDGKTIASTALDGVVSLWEAPTLRLIRRSNLSDTGVCRVAFSPDGKAILVARPRMSLSSRGWKAEKLNDQVSGHRRRTPR